MSNVDNVYIADTFNNLIRKVTVSTAIITTIAGTGTTTYSGDNGAATSATLDHPSGVTLDTSGRTLYYCLLHRYIVICTVSDNIVDNHKLIFLCPI